MIVIFNVATLFCFYKTALSNRSSDHQIQIDKEVNKSRPFRDMNLLFMTGGIKDRVTWCQ